MRRWSPLAPIPWVLAGLLVFAPDRVPLAQTTGKAAAKSQAKKKPPRIPIPGVGGAAPPRKKPAAGTNATPTVPGSGPLLPASPVGPGRIPAPVFGPGQTPGLPGLPGLQARQINPLLFGVSLPTLPLPPAKGVDPLPGLLRSAGVTNVRLAIRWPEIERTKAKRDWQPTDRSVRYLAKQGFPIVATVEGSPEWTGQPGLPSAGVAPDLERFAYAAASRYKGAINLWEFWSEPDAGPAWPDTVPALRGRSGPSKEGSYASLLQAFARGVKRANPQAQVAVGGLAIHDTRFLANLYQMGVQASFDAVALHPSTPRDVVDFAWIESIRALMIAKGDAAKPIWMTDWGWSTAASRPDSVTELHQARLVRQSFAGMRDRPFIVLADYRALADWRQRAADPASLSVTGLLSQTLQPKPAYLAFREMATGFNPEAATRFTRVPLVGPLSQAEEAGVRGSALQVLVDASRATGPLSRVWEGIAQGYDPAIPTLSAEIAGPLKAIGARIVRFDPFPNPDWVQPDRIVVAEGTNDSASPAGPGFTIRWQYADSMMDALEASGASAMLNIATMPTGLSSPAGNPRMPRDLGAWSSFIRQVVRRYNRGGRRAVTYWELSSEPNRGDFALEEWLRLYETFARAVTAEDPKARVGGPATAGYDETWLRGVAERCERDRIPLHFLSWHAAGQPPSEYGRQVESARGWLRNLRGLDKTELIVSEWNPSARVAADNDTVAGAARLASAVEGMLSGGPDHALYYTLREGPDPRTPSARLSGRWGLLTHDGRPKASYNLLRLLERLGPERISAASEESEIHALASRSTDRVSVLLWSDPPEGSEADRLDTPVSIRVNGLGWKSATQGEEWVVDRRHGDIASNPARASLEAAGRFSVAAGDVEIPVVLEPHAITLIELRPGPTTPVELSLESPRYVVYGGSRVPLTARVHNGSAQAKQITLTLGGRDEAAGAGRGVRATITLAPNETRGVPLTATVDPRRAEGQQFFTVTASAGEAASTSVKLAPPLTARLEKSRIDVPPRAGTAERMARFTLVLDNRADRPATLGVAGGTTSVSVTVPARQTAAVPITIPVPRDAEGVLAVPIRVVQGTRAIETLTATVGAEAPAQFAAAMPRINGDLSEWVDAEKLTLRPALRDRRGSLSSLSGQAMTMWDDHALYLALSLTDDAIASTPTSAVQTVGPPEVQLSLGPASQQTGPSPVFNIDPARTGERLYRATAGRGPGAIVSAARVAVRNDGRRTVMELAIPWSELGGAAPAPGARLAFALRVNDVKGRGRPGLEYAGALPGDAPVRLPTLVIRKR